MTLSLTADDATSGVAQMRVTNDNITWSDWEPCATSKQWTLLTGDGLKGVTVRYKDNAGLISSYSDSIILDATKPTANAGIDQTVNEDTLVTFDGSALTDNVGLTLHMDIHRRHKQNTNWSKTNVHFQHAKRIHNHSKRNRRRWKLGNRHNNSNSTLS